MRFMDLTGNRFGRWEVLGRDKHNPRKWVCCCECGAIKSVDRGNLKSGASKSCGCLSRQMASDRCAKHGRYDTKEHKIWMSMVSRSRGQGSHGHYYQELGVEVCDRWLEPDGQGFLNFLEDMGECPEGLTLDRVDNREGYFKENCQWADRSQQGSNRRKNSSNTSGRIGVHFRKDQRKWRVAIKVKGCVHNIGSFTSYEEACEACTEAEIDLLGYSREDY